MTFYGLYHCFVSNFICIDSVGKCSGLLFVLLFHGYSWFHYRTGHSVSPQPITWRHSIHIVHSILLYGFSHLFHFPFGGLILYKFIPLTGYDLMQNIYACWLWSYKNGGCRLLNWYIETWPLKGTKEIAERLEDWHQEINSWFNANTEQI